VFGIFFVLFKRELTYYITRNHKKKGTHWVPFFAI